ncbi:MAG: hypothetical protein D4R92_05520 [Actinobacteria bacterium]|nr:MAG: hypothetical protein D4R92_05520 [Actinomycetota bacterium]
MPPCLPLALNAIGEGGVISKWGFKLCHEWRSLQRLGGSGGQGSEVNTSGSTTRGLRAVKAKVNAQRN